MNVTNGDCCHAHGADDTGDTAKVVVDVSRAKWDADVVRSVMTDLGWAEVRHTRITNCIHFPCSTEIMPHCKIPPILEIAGL